MSLRDLTSRLLRRPESITDDELSALSRLLEAPSVGWRAACAAVAALALQRPRSARVAERFDAWSAALLNHQSADEVASLRLLEGLAARGQLGELTEAKALGRSASGHRASVSHALAQAARCVAWCPEHVTWGDLVRLARRARGILHAEIFLADVLDRWLWLHPNLRAEGSRPALRELEAVLGARSRWPQTRELARRRLRAAAAPAETPAAALPGAPARMMVAQNLEIGQGDEILRLGLLLSILLAVAPATQFDVITRRRHLWDHPRLRPIAIDDEEAVKASLEAADGFAWTDEPLTPEIRLVEWLPEALERRAAEASWAIEMVTKNCHAVFRQLRLGGPCRLAELRPEMPPRHATDTLERLACALDAGWIREARTRPGGAPETAAPFVGRASREADAALERRRGDRARPLAVVQPFGGFTEVKGYTRCDGPRLVQELEALADEGFRVVLLPTFEEWGSAAVVGDLIEALPPAAARHVTAAPSPADPPAWLRERPELSPPDRVMRLFKYWISRADQVVAVEGWVCHLASLLGRPVRMVLWAGSFSPDWYPRDARWASGLSAGCPPRSLDLSAGAAPPVLGLADRGLLSLALGAEGLSDHTLVSRLFASVDPEIRVLALGAAAAGLESQALAEIATRGLGDPAAAVRAAAATAWLGRPDLRKSWPAAPETLEAHRWIAAENWPRVADLGPAALAALALAARGERNFIRRQAKRLLEAVLRERAEARSGAVAGPPPGAS